MDISFLDQVPVHAGQLILSAYNLLYFIVLDPDKCKLFYFILFLLNIT